MLARRKNAFEKRPSMRITPDFIAPDVSTIDFEALRGNGIKACFIDLDNTVVDYASYEVTKEFKDTLKNCGLKIFIATNRPKNRDLKDLKEDLCATGIVHPHGVFGKPFKRYFTNGLRDNNLSSHEVVMVGDRYFQDILGANRAGMYSLLVHKFGSTRSIIDRLISAVEQRLTVYLSKRYH